MVIGSACAVMPTSIMMVASKNLIFLIENIFFIVVIVYWVIT